ncbi:MAG: PEP-CTERM sorting domain-containing protein, partial [Pirellulales bacterium]|nr:PEP-CTERM sorting domain-containing protein [Pirellulales bacterium]
AAVHVGTLSPTGGDLVIGSPLASTGTVNLSGGTLDVAHTDGTYGGNIAAGGSASSATFNFTGGTLKVITWNPVGPSGGNLGNLVQNGAGSFLDVTANNTTLAQSSKYDLGAGSAEVGAGFALTTNGVLNSAGAGTITVGAGGLLTAGSESIAVDTLNLNGGTATAGGIGVSVATALTTVTGAAGVGTINGDLSLGDNNTVTLDLGNTGFGQSDLISVSGNVAFDGDLHLNLLYSPAVSDMIDVFDFVIGSGTFDAITASAGTWSMNYATGILTCTAPGFGAGAAVPEPATVLLLSLAMAGLLGTRPARRR